MTIDEASEELIRQRNLALVAHGNSLLDRGMNVDDEAFRKSMLDYAGLLETWRWDSMMRILRLVQPAMVDNATATLN
jgi:hypothetical protein